MKPYVNFDELATAPVVMDGLALLRDHLFKPIGKNRRGIDFTWEDCERAIVRQLDLRGKKKALFLGHSRRWAETPIA
jgi:hypothetical protein